MTNAKTTRRALLVSILSLLLSMSMLAGSTFAWFSDSASIGVNKIQAGTLDIALEISYDNGTTWEDAKDKTIDFVAKDGNKDILWEPGCTYELPMLRVVNKGSLALQFRVAISGIDGNAKLNEVIDWNYSYKAGEGVSYYNWSAENGIIFGLSAGGNMPFVISGHMQETAGDEYQGLSIEGISITVLATQLPEEYDSFNNTYDQSADGTPDLPQYVTVNNSVDLVEALKAADANDIVFAGSGKYEINENVETAGVLAVVKGADVEINLNGYKISSKVSSSENVPTILNKGVLTINGGIIENKNGTAGKTNVAAVKNEDGVLTLNNCTIKNVAPTSGGDYAVTVSGGKVIMNNCTVEGGRGGIAVSKDGCVEMTGGSVSANVYYPLYIQGTGNSVFENVTFTKLNNSKGKAISYNLFKDGEGTAAFIGCAFNSETAKVIPFDIYKITTGFTFENCTFSNVTDPNA